MGGDVAYYVQGRDTTVYFTPAGVTFVLTPPPEARARNVAFGAARPDFPAPQPRWTLKLDFVGAKPDARPVGEDETTAVVSYFKGSRSQWKSGLPTFSRVVYRNLWPGIDLAYEGTVDRIKYTFVVRPGADPGRIRFACRGATALLQDDSGGLEIATPAGNFRDARPHASQEGSDRNVDCSFAIARGAGAPGYGFRVGKYDRTRPLIIDPVILVYCGYIGGAGADGGYGFGIAVDDARNAYISGTTSSLEATFPVAAGPDLTYNGGSYDAFVAKLSPAGTALLYLGYIGGNDYDVGHAIRVDSLGCAYLVGQTVSEAATFPVTVGPDLTHNGPGTVDGFVAKVNAAGTALVYCGYIGGTSNEEGYGLAVDGAGCAYASGITASDETSFPVTVGPDLTYNGGGDAWIAKVSPDGSALVYCGYIGGTSGEWGFGMAVDVAGNAYMSGFGSSTEATFPVRVGPDLTYNGGANDAFVAKINPAGTALVYCGYIGGTGDDQAMCAAVDALGAAHVAGYAGSTQATFPVTVGPDLTYNGGVRDAFVAKVRPDGTALEHAGYIGGDGDDIAHAIAVDDTGSVHVAGETSSSEATFPVAGGPDVTYNGARDGFVAKVRSDGTGLDRAGYIGGAGDEAIFGVAVDDARDTYVAGATTSNQATFPVVVGPDLTYGGGANDAFVAKLGLDPGAVCLWRSDVTRLLPHTPPRNAVYLVPPSAEDIALQGAAYQCPFASGNLEPDASALRNGVVLSLYQVNLATPTLRLAKSGTTILFRF